MLTIIHTSRMVVYSHSLGVNTMLTKDGVITELKGRNISKVAREVKVTRSYLSNLANGGRKQVSWDMIKKLSDYLEATK